MRSGTGRHRRPRQAPALVVAAGVTGAGMALPLLSTGPAQAVGDAAWDRAAECESGGLWSANTGNGYYGGFQLTLEMWRGHGGLEFAGRPDLASRMQQIAVLERILAAQGQQALPGCALISGLWDEFREETEQAGERAEGPEGAQEDARESARENAPEEARERDQAADRAAEQEGGGAGGSAEREAGGGSREAAGRGEDGTEQEAGGPGEPREPGERAEVEAPGEAPAGTEAGAGTESGGTGRHRGGPDPQDAGRAGEPGGGRHAGRGGERAGSIGAGVYEVAPGDTLSAIAVEGGIPGGWPALYAANKSVIGDDPDLILPGQPLDLEVMDR